MEEFLSEQIGGRVERTKSDKGPFPVSERE